MRKVVRIMAIQDLGGRREGQKLKSLLVWQILLRHTDENHPLRAEKIVELLEDEYGVTSGEHSVCRDIKELQRLYEEDEDEGFFRGERFKYKIVYDGSGERGYKVVKRPCTLIDRGKSRNNRLPDYVQVINRAIRNDHKIKFQYTKYTLSNRTEQTPRRRGKDYVLSPFKILVTEGNYYLIAYNGKKIVHYRIDRMQSVEEIPDAPREGIKEFEKIDLRTYPQKVFSMFGGEEKRVQIRFTNDLLDTVIERFGASDPTYTKYDDNHFTVSAAVEVSNMFYSWVCSFRKKATIIGPPEVVEEFQQFLSDIQGRYE